MDEEWPTTRGRAADHQRTKSSWPLDGAQLWEFGEVFLIVVVYLHDTHFLLLSVWGAEVRGGWRLQRRYPAAGGRGRDSRVKGHSQ